MHVRLIDQNVFPYSGNAIEHLTSINNIRKYLEKPEGHRSLRRIQLLCLYQQGRVWLLVMWGPGTWYWLHSEQIWWLLYLLVGVAVWRELEDRTIIARHQLYRMKYTCNVISLLHIKIKCLSYICVEVSGWDKMVPLSVWRKAALHLQ